MDTPDIKQSIRAFLTDLPGSEGLSNTSDDESLLDSGVIDSASMIDLIAHIEKTFSISIQDDDMTPENFETIEAIAGYVERQQALPDV